MYKILTKMSHIYHISEKYAYSLVIIHFKAPFEIKLSQNLQVVMYFGQFKLSIFKYYIHNKDIQIIIQNVKSIQDLRQCVHNNLQS